MQSSTRRRGEGILGSANVINEAQTKVRPIVFAVIWFEIGWERFLFLSPTVELRPGGQHPHQLCWWRWDGTELASGQTARRGDFDRGAA